MTFMNNTREKIAKKFRWLIKFSRQVGVEIILKAEPTLNLYLMYDIVIVLILNKKIETENYNL